MRALLLLLGSGVLLASCSTVPPFKGNDTGGIMAWSPQAYELRNEIAAEHCAKYRKVHRITSVHPRYGDYIDFKCYWPRGVDPWRAVITRSY
jgi:hypothetical protein